MTGAVLFAILALSARAAPAPEDPVAKFWTLRDAGKASEAYYYLRAKLRRFPSDAGLQRAFLIYSDLTGQLDSAAAEYETVFSSSPTDLNAYLLASGPGAAV